MNVVSDPDPQNALSFNAIRQNFPGLAGEAPLSVLNDISFNVPRRKFVSVIGPSGCGKSTLMQIVEFPLLLRGIKPAERRARAQEAIDKVDLSGFELHYSHQLSGGMQKRVSIARMLVYKPDTILMDEPFGALDAQTRMVMQHDLQVMLASEGASVLFVTHDITEAVMLSDSVIIMSRRPARVLAEVSIDLRRPRDMFEPHTIPGFAEAYDRVWSIFRSELNVRRAA